VQSLKSSHEQEGTRGTPSLAAMLFADARRSSREEGRALPRSFGEKQGTFRRTQGVLGQRRPRPRPPTPIPGLTRTPKPLAGSLWVPDHR